MNRWAILERPLRGVVVAATLQEYDNPLHTADLLP